MNYLFLFFKDPRFERIIDVLPIKVELAGEKIKKILKVNEMGLMLMMFSNFYFFNLILKITTNVKAGVNVKAALMSLNTAFLPTSRSHFMLNLSVYFINHCLAVLCKFLGDFWAFWKELFFSKDRLN